MTISDIELVPVFTQREYGYVSGHVIVRISDADGLFGLGEISDQRLPDSARLQTVLGRLLQGRSTDDIFAINELLLDQDLGPGVAAAGVAAGVDLALWDLQGRRRGQPVWQLLGGRCRDSMRVCYPIFGTADPAQGERNVERVQRVVDNGHDLIRYYISGNLDVDYRFLTHVRDRFGDRIAFKSFDFSHKFDELDAALRYYDRLRPLAPIHVEAPSRDLELTAEFVKRVDLPVSMHAGLLDRAYDIVTRGAADILNIATSTAGITYARHYWALAKAADVDLLIGTDQEATIGINAQMHFAASLPVLDYPGDPFGTLLYLEDVVQERSRYEGGRLYLPAGPGLGVELDPEAVAAQQRRGDPGPNQPAGWRVA